MSNIQSTTGKWLFYFAPALIPNIETNVDVKRSYTVLGSWLWVCILSYGAYTIWGTGVADHPWCDPDSWLQAHMIWHLLCAVATLSFFNFYRNETNQ